MCDIGHLHEPGYNSGKFLSFPLHSSVRFASGENSMNCNRCLLILAMMARLFMSSGEANGAVLQPAQPQVSTLPGTSSGSQDSIRFDQAPMSAFIKEMIRRLGIALVVVHNIPLTQTVTLYKEAPVSRQHLLDLFIGALRDNNAILVKSRTVYQIIPLSRHVRATLEPVTTAEIVSAPLEVAGVMMAYAGASLSSFCRDIAVRLDITPIIIDPAVQGTVTIYGSRPITQEMVFPTLLAVLENNNARIVECAGTYEVVPVSRYLPAGCEPLLRQPSPRLISGTLPQTIVVRPDELESHVVSRVEPNRLLPVTKQKLSGKVILEITLDERGNIDILRVSRPAVSEELNQAAIQAVRQWRFRPFTEPDGVPKRAIGALTIAFNPPE
jgi:TonB family protein